MPLGTAPGNTPRSRPTMRSRQACAAPWGINFRRRGGCPAQPQLPPLQQ